MAYGKITKKQMEILECIKQAILDKGYPPTVRELCDMVHLKSTSSIHANLEALERNGYIRRDPSKPRAIEIVDESFYMTKTDMVNVPLVGQVAAGMPILDSQNIETYYPIPSEFMPRETAFMLKVKGESMINAGILDGDTVLVKRRYGCGPHRRFRHGKDLLPGGRSYPPAAGE